MRLRYCPPIIPPASGTTIDESGRRRHLWWSVRDIVTFGPLRRRIGGGK